MGRDRGPQRLMFIKNVLTSSTQGAGFEAEYLVIAGGGGGASAYGGGGAGGYRTGTGIFNVGASYTVTVGAGGTGDAAGGPLGSQGGDGGDSTFFNTTSTGGGGGSSYDPSSTGRSGGSGGGAGYTASGGVGGSGNTPATTPSQGNDGGPSSGSAPYYGGGGGGGAGAAGGTGTATNGGNGGDGVSSALTGANVYRAGGGGAGNYSVANGGIGGAGGGGNAGSPGVAGVAGTANTGSGGGGGHAGSAGVGAWTGGGAGGSGVVIIKLPRKIIAEFSAGVAYNYIPVDGFHVYEITGAGVSDTVTFKDGSDIPVTINDSLRFNDNDTAYLTRTPASAGNRKTWTWSAWVKRAGLTGARQGLFTCTNSGGTDYTGMEIDPTNGLRLYDNNAGGAFLTSALFRDPSAWYHIVLNYNTTNSTASERLKLYVNGALVSAFSSITYPTLNADSRINSTNQHSIGSWVPSSVPYPFDGYMADVYLIDGEALDPSNFGHADDNGVWQPIAYPGTYGTNGFHLDFADNSTAAALGTDVSGNGNDWTPSGITTDDQMSDTPSVNYCTWNPLDKAIAELSDGNLYATHTPTAWVQGRANFAMVTGKWYWEASGNTQYAMVGISLASQSQTTYFGQGAASWGYYSLNGAIYRDNTSFTYGATWTSSDTIGIAFDADTGQLYFYKNGVAQGLAATVPTGQTYFPAVAIYNTSVRHNFGQSAFTYTPPTGYSALSSANLPAPTIADGKEHFDIALYTGDGGSQNVRGFEFQPDFAWVKERATTEWHQLYDALRGTGALFSNDTSAELTLSGISFLSNGFTASDTFRTNQRGLTYVGWAWNAGGSTVTNTDGTITSQVRANTTAGFSIVGWTGGGVSGTAGHGLAQAPEIYIYKNRSIAANWAVAFTLIDGSLDFMYLNLTNAAGNAVQGLPTSSVISLNAGAGDVNSGQNYIAYCFHSVDGFSKFGTYTGNGSADGPFVYTGFRPAFVMVKRTNSTGNWNILDTTRSPYNANFPLLLANTSGAEIAVSTFIDATANGFKFRTTGTDFNTTGGTYIYMAFAENPFKTARAR